MHRASARFDELRSHGTHLDILEMSVHADIDGGHCAVDCSAILKLDGDRLVVHLHQKANELHGDCSRPLVPPVGPRPPPTATAAAILACRAALEIVKVEPPCHPTLCRLDRQILALWLILAMRCCPASAQSYDPPKLCLLLLCAAPTHRGFRAHQFLIGPPNARLPFPEKKGRRRASSVARRVCDLLLFLSCCSGRGVVGIGACSRRTALGTYPYPRVRHASISIPTLDNIPIFRVFCHSYKNIPVKYTVHRTEPASHTLMYICNSSTLSADIRVAFSCWCSRDSFTSEIVATWLASLTALGRQVPPLYLSPRYILS